jgi:hypothetical protein
MRHFGLCEVDWHDLDIDLSEQVVATNIITPWEYQDALRLLQRDECQSLDDRNRCFSRQLSPKLLSSFFVLLWI